MKRILRSVVLSACACLIAMPSFAQFGVFDKTVDWGSAASPPQRGNFKIPGSVTVTGTGANTQYIMQGNGDDIWDNNDEGFFVYKEQTGDWRLSAKVYWNEPGTSQWSKIGVMIRENATAAGSRHYWIELRGNGFGDQTDAQWRTTANAASGNAEVFGPGGAKLIDPGDGLWLRVTRLAAQNTFFSEYSLDGTNWSFGHSQTQTGWGATAAFGLAITSHVDDGFLVEARVTDVKLEQVPALITINRTIAAIGFKANDEVDVKLVAQNTSPSASSQTITETVPQGWTVSGITNGGVLSGSTITWTNLSLPQGTTELSYKAKAPANVDGIYNARWSGSGGSLPFGGQGALTKILDGVGEFTGSAEIVPYRHATRGNTHADGWAEYDAANDIYEVGGNGWDIQENEDEFFYLYKQIMGSFRAEATVEYGAQNPHDWTKIGLMARQDLDPGSPHFFVIFRGLQDIVEGGGRSVRNGGFSGPGTTLPTAMHRQPVRVAIIREANTFRSEYFNTTTNAWVAQHSAEYTMTNNILFGLAATSHVDDTASWGVGLFSDLEITEIVSVGEWMIH